MSALRFLLARRRKEHARSAPDWRWARSPEKTDDFSSRHHQRAQLKSATAIGFVPPKFVRRGQHFCYFQLAGLTQPAMKNLEKKITLEINKHRLGIFVASFRATASQGLLSWANVNKARPIFSGAQSFGGENQFPRKTGEISTAHFFTGNRPGAALDD